MRSSVLRFAVARFIELGHEQIDTNCNEVNKQRNFSTNKILPYFKAAKCVYNTLTEPNMCYADTVWGELPATSSKTLQKYKNALPASF